MAAFHGKRGIGTFTGLTITDHIVSWTIDATAEAAEATVMDATAVGATVHWKDYTIGYKDWTATVELVTPSGGVGLTALGTEAALTLDTGDGLSLAGAAICIGISPTSGIDGTATTTLSFQGVSQLVAT